MNQSRGHVYNECSSLTYYDFGTRLVVVSYILMHLGIVAYVLYFGMTHKVINNYEAELSMEFARLLGWPLLLIAFTVFAGSLVFLEHNGYRLNTTHCNVVTHLFFVSLYLAVVALTFTNFNLIKLALLW